MLLFVRRLWGKTTFRRGNLLRCSHVGLLKWNIVPISFCSFSAIWHGNESLLIFCRFISLRNKVYPCSKVRFGFILAEFRN